VQVGEGEGKIKIIFIKSTVCTKERNRAEEERKDNSEKQLKTGK
jgi:hypothetical protein